MITGCNSTASHRQGTSFVAEWYHVKGEKVASIKVAFDVRPFAAMFGAQHG